MTKEQKDQFAESFMTIVGIANPHHLKLAMRKDTHSGYVQAQKALNALVDLKRLERREKLYLVPGCKSEGSEHALAVTQIIAEIFSKFDNPRIYREKLIEEKGLRPDIICFVEKDGKALCLIIEVVREESPEYLNMKQNVWEQWPEAITFLSNLFKSQIKHFDFVTSDELNLYWESV
jgi:hypothetical protein